MERLEYMGNTLGYESAKGMYGFKVDDHWSLMCSICFTIVCISCVHCVFIPIFSRIIYYSTPCLVVRDAWSQWKRADQMTSQMR